MKRAVLVAAGFIAVSAPASAQYIPRPMAPIGPLPPASVSEMVRQMGLQPVGAPVRSGPVYFQRAADYYGKPLRVVIDAHRAQVVSVEPVGGPPMLHRGPYASAGAPYWRRPYAYPYGVPDDEAIAPPGSAMAPHGRPPQAGLPPATQPKPAAKSASITPTKPPVPRKRPAAAPQETVGSVEPLRAATESAPTPAEKPAAAAPPPAPANPANAMPPVTPLE
jgi:hypothetical protein